jgi:hypothetical protein
VLGVKATNEFTSRSYCKIEATELPWVLHAGLELVGVQGHDAVVSRPAARSQFVQRAIGEHVLEPTVGLEQELGANLHHAVESVMARERAVGGSASGPRLDRQEGERESGGKCGLPTQAFLPKSAKPNETNADNVRWVFLGPSRFSVKTPAYEGWKSLDFLGFSRQNRVISMGCAGFSTDVFS